MKLVIEMDVGEANDLMRFALRALEESTTARERQELLLRFIGQGAPAEGGRHEKG